ncbi:PREDICTED: ATP-dependent RNA helicase DEAH13 [Tarenaya hassleriana]|uniref:ATP-dependent RNA helicase DEAH13 n=1 Tax=Tarenaya hassleriana TaxID=28532 RepID=UPI00053C9099|nr:PREDICTED: ATP-dependent RNA helicase DEAH13 [Tarenaya hassleriana]XP_010523963.1 PREDICTED: ATP-dependent RNA helicase DEAH13 [Tarenaya hassleriana]
MMGTDSNLEILPPKKKIKKNKGTKQVPEKLDSKENTKLSKSQKRKLKKLEEEKEKEIMFAKSAELLEKYKISEDAYSLLRSSKVIGRAETKLEKRRRAMQFSKVGLTAPPGDESLERNEDCHSFMTEPMTQEHAEMPNTCSGSSCVTGELVHAPELGSEDGHEAKMSIEEVCEQLGSNPTQEETANVIMETSPRGGDKGPKRKDGSGHYDDIGAKRNSHPTEFSVQRTHVAPCVVHVSRPTEVEEKRKDLPIVMMEQEIMEAINYHPTVIISGETGCGKTTQVPQFLYEAGFGSKQFSSRSGIIGITQPRRVAVLATAKRVAFELGFRLGKEVGFQVRYDKKIGDNSSIKFMTDGILLREIQNDFLLRRYSVIILDEAHERSLNTDILIGMLTRVIRLRQVYYEEQQKILQSGRSISPENSIIPLKLILMSATLRVEDFLSGRRLFPDLPPVIEVPTRQYPVTIHFSKKTEIVDYIGQAYKKVMSIHKKLPQGGVLVFVTGQREVDYLCQKLRKASNELVARGAKRGTSTSVDDSPQMSSVDGVDMKEISEAFGDGSHHQNNRFNSSEEDLSEMADSFDKSDDVYESDEESDWETLDDNQGDNFIGSFGEEGNLDSLKAAFDVLAGKCQSNSTKQGSPVVVEEYTGQPISSTKEVEEGKDTTSCGLRVLPLYAMLPPAAQLRVFEEIKEGERLVVVATNVAETSLTIPGIKYVVDTGRVKVKSYNPSTGIESYEVQWISKASASQRAGRAGRTGPGHCYRLYSSAVFNNIFQDFSPPEITKVPVDGVVLLMKSMNIDKVENFPFPTPPESSAIKEAERCLKAIEALDSNGSLTRLGKAMAHYPMSPRHSRMLLTVIQMMGDVKSYSRANLILGYAVTAVAALTLPNPFIMQFEGDKSEKNESDKDESLKHRRKETREKIKAARERFSNPSSDALTLAYALQCFELSENHTYFCEANGLHLKTMEETSKLRQQLLQIVFNQNRNSGVEEEFSWSHGNIIDVENAWRQTTAPAKYPLLQHEEELIGHAICAGWADRVARKTRAAEYKACAVQEPVFIHRWSSIANAAPEFLVYSELLRTKRIYMHGATRVRPEWLVRHARSLCTFSAPLKEPRPYYSVKEDKVFYWVVPSFGPHLWELPPHNTPVTDELDSAAVFGCALLQGEVLPCLKEARQLMAAKPEAMMEREAWGQERIGGLVRELKERRIHSWEKLRETWDTNPKALYREIEEWFQKKFRQRFAGFWVRMLREAQAEPRQRFGKKKMKIAS